jgi:S1-C subfamily serine protease
MDSEEKPVPAPSEPPVIKVTPEEAAKAVPPPPRPRFQPPIPPKVEEGPRTSRLAVASLVFGILGLPLTCLVGAIALLAGALGLAATHADTNLRGRKLAVAGLLLGVLSFAGWSFALWYYLGHAGAKMPDGPPRLLEVVAGPPPEGLKNSPEPYRSALLANVVVMGSRSGLRWSGSGVVVDREGDTLRILTNRHVAEGPSAIGPQADLPSLWILFSSGESAAATTVWSAQGGVDLAVLESRARTAQEVPAMKPRMREVTIADEVFAIGNPLEYRWSLTKGVVSSVRQVNMGGVAMKVYQTQTPISSGNSGGGLYTKEGHLVGVNTWSADKSISEGLGFSISVETLIHHLKAAGLPWAARLVEGARQ